MSNVQNIFNECAKFYNFLPVPIYWLSVDGRLVGANNAFFNSLGRSEEYCLGKTAHQVYPKDLADQITWLDNQVIKEKSALNQEEMFLDSQDNTRYYRTYKSPLFSAENEVIGIIGVSMDITVEKQYEKLEKQILENQAKLEVKATLAQCLEELSHTITHFKSSILDEKIKSCGDNKSLKPSQVSIDDFKNIKLTKREREIIYFLSLNKPPKEIAAILSMIENKELSPLTISSIIDKQLYVKFNVNSVGRLLEVANKLKLIPFTI